MEKRKFLEQVSFYLFAFNINRQVAHYIACQFALESNFGQSSLSTCMSNYCGMKRPVRRISTATNVYCSKDKFACYLSLADCVVDFVLCLVYHNVTPVKCDTIEHYIDSIKVWYCPDSDYVDRIQTIYNQFYND